mmetsp:Transcript_3095/g.5517  ORF Transcript_3095/g.5517 Transcript_3095/m.5517 type:complete len:216 (-) Transcript_3095:14-661(-)
MVPHRGVFDDDANAAGPYDFRHIRAGLANDRNAHLRKMDCAGDVTLWLDLPTHEARLPAPCRRLSEGVPLRGEAYITPRQDLRQRVELVVHQLALEVVLVEDGLNLSVHRLADDHPHNQGHLRRSPHQGLGHLGGPGEVGGVAVVAHDGRAVWGKVLWVRDVVWQDVRVVFDVADHHSFNSVPLKRLLQISILDYCEVRVVLFTPGVSFVWFNYS